MAQRDIVRSPKPLLSANSTPAGKKSIIAEAAGGTAAGCAAICCCFPFTAANLLFLTVYKFPVGVCRKVWKKHKRRRLEKKSKALLKAGGAAGSIPRGFVDADAEVVWMKVMGRVVLDGGDATTDDREFEEMWDRFHGTGFWRSPTRRGA